MSAPGATLVVGRITGCYGIKGWVKIHSFTEPAENFFAFTEFKLKRPRGEEPVQFDQGRRHGKGLVAHIAGCDDRTAAEGYRGLDVSVSADALPELAQDDYYWHQLQGLEVWCREREGDPKESILLGRVDHLLETGANDVLVVKACEGSIDDDERLLPYLFGDVVTDIDLAAGRMDVDWSRDY